MPGRDKRVGRPENWIGALALAAAVTGTLGCGARSALPDLDAPPERPAVMPDAGVCTVPTPIELPESLSHHARRPAFTRLARSGEIAVVYGLDTPEPPDPTAVPIADAVLDPWGPWPPVVKGPFPIWPTGGATFAVDVGETQGFVIVAGLLSSPANPQPSLGYGYDMAPTGGGMIAPMGNGDEATSALFMATNLESDTGDLASFFMGGDGLHLSSHRLALLTQGSTGPGVTSGPCASAPIVADAIPRGTGYLIGTSGHWNQPAFNCEEVPPSGPWSIHLGVSLEAPLGGLGDVSAEVGPFTDPLVRIRLSRRSDGGWLFSQTRDPNGNTSPIRAQRVVAGESLANPKLDVSFAPFEPVPAGRSGFAAAPLGDGFALAWVGPGAAIGVALFDADGHETGATTVPAAPGATIEGPVTVLAAQDASALLVGWSETAPQAVARIKVVRFDCLTTKGL